jgi:hypothetical protein
MSWEGIASVEPENKAGAAFTCNDDYWSKLIVAD